jgi:plasmid stability protein
MRTTVDIPDMLYRQLKTRAATEGRSVKELILRGVQGQLRGGESKRSRRVKLPIVRSKKPGLVNLDNASIYKIIPFP